MPKSYKTWNVGMINLRFKITVISDGENMGIRLENMIRPVFQ